MIIIKPVVTDFYIPGWSPGVYDYSLETKLIADSNKIFYESADFQLKWNTPNKLTGHLKPITRNGGAQRFLLLDSNLQFQAAFKNGLVRIKRFPLKYFRTLKCRVGWGKGEKGVRVCHFAVLPFFNGDLILA